MGQVFSATMVLDSYVALATQYEWVDTRTGMMGGPVRVRRAPVGVVAAITPWNVPLFIAALKLGPGLLAGCTFVLKPSPETPLDSYPLAEAIIEAGFPEGVINIIPAGRETGEYLVKHPDDRQGELHRLDRGGHAHRRAVRRSAQALHARARRQVGGDRARRREPRRSRCSTSSCRAA